MPDAAHAIWVSEVARMMEGDEYWDDQEVPSEEEVAEAKERAYRAVRALEDRGFTIIKPAPEVDDTVSYDEPDGEGEGSPIMHDPSTEELQRDLMKEVSAVPTTMGEVDTAIASRAARELWGEEED
jgi:hypothetical protein